MTEPTKTASSKSSKFNDAVERATGVAPEGTAPTVSVGGSDALITKFSPDDLAKMATSGEWEFAPQLKALEEGDMIAGILEGNGPEAEFEHMDKVTGEVTVNRVQTWIIASPDGTQRASILSSAQLDRKLAPFVGGPVRIVRGKDIKTSNGHRVTDYLVAGPKMADGKRRQWASLPAAAAPVQAQIAAPANGVTEPAAAS